MTRSHSRGLLYTAPPAPDREDETESSASEVDDPSTDADTSTAVPADD